MLMHLSRRHIDERLSNSLLTDLLENGLDMRLVM